MSIFIAAVLLSAPIAANKDQDIAADCANRADGTAMAATNWLSLVCESGQARQSVTVAKESQPPKTLAQRERVRRVPATPSGNKAPE